VGPFRIARKYCARFLRQPDYPVAVTPVPANITWNRAEDFDDWRIAVREFESFGRQFALNAS